MIKIKKYIQVMIVILMFVSIVTVQSKTLNSPSLWTPGNLEIHHIDVGQGDSTLVISPTGKSLLIDACETNWNSNAVGKRIATYIQGVLGSKHIDYAVITHFHLDHIGYVKYGGLWYLANNGFTIGETIHRNYKEYLGQTSGTFTRWATYFGDDDGIKKLNPVLVQYGTKQIDLGPEITVDIKTFDGNGYINLGDFSKDKAPPSENDYSIGMKITFNQFDEWISGDLDGQYNISSYGYAYHDIEVWTAPEVGDVDVYRVHHHGSDHSSSPTFVKELNPRVSIISVGDGNTYGHPKQSVVDLLNSICDLYLTEHGEPKTNLGKATVGGNIIIKTSDGETYTVNYTVNGKSYSKTYEATDPERIDKDNDGYFIEVDPDDNDPNVIPKPNGGYDTKYQPEI